MSEAFRWPTLAEAYTQICVGEPPWVAFGNFLHGWHEGDVEDHVRQITEPLALPEPCPDRLWRWAVFCAGSAEYLSAQVGMECPSWALVPTYHLSTAWYGFDSPGSGKPEVQMYLQQTTPEVFRRRNLFCGDRVFLSKYDFARASRARQAVS